MNIWITSDHHFGHDSMYKFTNKDGRRIRPWAQTAEEGDELMIESWNKVVGQHDRVYHLGDIAIKRKALQHIKRLKGKIVLIRGNHDIFKLNDYVGLVSDIRGSHKVDKFILSHYPIHRGSIPRWCSGNLHGHTHHQYVQRKHLFGWKDDPLYSNMCIEHTGLAPVPYETILHFAGKLWR